MEKQTSLSRTRRAPARLPEAGSALDRSTVLRFTFDGRGYTAYAGDTIASVGASGGNPESGLYFELRYQGKPFDPLPWVTLR